MVDVGVMVFCRSANNASETKGIQFEDSYRERKSKV